MSVPEIDHTRLKALFGDVCDLPTPEAARARLAELKATPDECAQVLQLLAHDDGHTTHLSAPVKHMVASAAGGELQPGDRLGAWTLVRELGAGGMGRVFEAQRSDGHYEQRSAIKVLRGFSGEAALAQLAHERQLLATLNHPHIARLLDGGTTPAGNPYLVMEHVEGGRIDEHVRRQAVGLDAVLSLFLMVCDAVAYAHRHLVVHCDIKPGNVLVDDEGRAKLLDFGIAQLAGRGGSELQAMTPRYASPEQREGAPATAASDIYSLGRLLDELLNVAPAIRSARAHELQALVAKTTAEDPADRYFDVRALVDDIGRLRRHEVLHALRSPSPDLSYVAAKFARRRWPWLLVVVLASLMAFSFTLRLVQERDRALNAEAAARQAQQLALGAKTVAEASARQAEAARGVADDASRQAERERDAARTAERAANDAERVASSERQRAEEQRLVAEQASRQARQDADTSRRVSELLVALFDGANPNQGGRPDIQAVDLLDRGRTQFAAAKDLSPELRATMSGVLGRVYENIGKPVVAIEQYNEAIRLERTLAPRRLLTESFLLSKLALAMANRNDHGRAEASARESLALAERGSPPDSLERAESLNTLGWVLTANGKLDEAEVRLQQSLAIRRAKLAGPSLHVGATLHNLAKAAHAGERYADAERYFREALAEKRALVPDDHPQVLVSNADLSMSLDRLRRSEEAQALLKEVLAHHRRVLGENNAITARVTNELSVVQRRAGLSAESAANSAAALAINQRLGGAGSAAANQSNLGMALSDLGDPGAEQHLRAALAQRQQMMRPDDSRVARSRQYLGRWLMENGRLPEAQEQLRAAWEIHRMTMAPHDSERIDSQLLLAMLALLNGRDDEAQGWMDGVAPARETFHDGARVLALRIAAMQAQARGDGPQAVAQQREALALGRSVYQPRHPLLLRLQLELAERLVAAGELDEARRLLDEGAVMLAAQHAGSPQRERTAVLRRRL